MMVNELSLFTGYGGFSLGLRLAGIPTRTVMYVEWERYPQEIIKARIKDGYLDDAPIWGDISTLDGEQLRGVVDLITAGFPCQPHSVAGLKRGAGDERNLWPETLRVIREVGPRYVILENVPGLLSAPTDGGAPAYGGTVVGELASLGYSIHWQTIGADDVGAPHRRKRWWCIGVLADPVSTGISGGDQRGFSTSRPETGEQQDGQGASNQLSDGGETDDELADAEYEGSSRPRSRDESCVTQHGTVYPSAEAGVADSDSNGTEWDQSQHRAGSRAKLGGEELADSERGSRVQAANPSVRQGREARVEERVWQDRSGDIRYNANDSSGGSDSELADSTESGLEGVGANGHQEGWQEPFRPVGLSSRTIPTWPPSPKDTDGWATLLAERPDLAPALDKEIESRLRGVDHGRSHRVDELKALGNGIVPAVVAEFLRRVAL